LVKRFFGEFLKLDYEFTYEELSEELNKVLIRPQLKEQIDGFLLELSEKEYLEDKTLSHEEIQVYLQRLMDFVKNMIYEDKVSKSETFIQKILNIRPKEERRLCRKGRLKKKILWMRRILMH